jgi:hypothetical protein
MALRNEHDIDMSIAALQAIKLAYSTYASSTPAQDIVDRVSDALEAPGYGILAKYVAEGIRQDRLAPAHQKPPK